MNIEALISKAAGEAVKADLITAAGENPDNAAKCAAVEAVFDIDASEIFANATSQKLAVVTILSKLDGLTAPVPGNGHSTLLDENGDPIYVDETFADLTAAHASTVITEDAAYTDTDELISDEWTSLFVRSGTVELTNAPVTATGAEAVAEAITGTELDAFVPESTTVRVEGGQIVEIVRVFIP